MQLANLLASKDALTFQQLQAVTTPVSTEYTGPYLTGDEIELENLAEYERKLNAMFDSVNESE
jgi:hypothetical protein